MRIDRPACSRRRGAPLAAALLAAFLLPALPVAAQTPRPLLVEGTNTVFQRVLTRPGAKLHQSANGPVLRPYPAFQPLYVFARQNNWVQVGPSASASPEGWLPEPESILWKQNIIGAFTNGAGRKRGVLFDTEERLRWFLNHEALPQLQDHLLTEADAGRGGSDGVVAVEPEAYVNIVDELYMMPILDFREDLHPANYEDLLLLKVASVPTREDTAPPPPQASSDQFDVGIVFVLDTTQSMDPYITGTRRVLERTIRRIENTEIGPLVNFGLIGFRDNDRAVQGLEYRTRTLLPLERRTDQTPVLQAIANTGTARVSTIGFNEDSLAGVEDAVDAIDWDQTRGNRDPINARYVILVTDAGPKDPRDPNARSQIGPAELERDAEGKNIAVMTLHLETPAGGEANHAYAAGQYRQLSRFQRGNYYYPVEGGSETTFEQVADRLVTAITDQVRVARGQQPLLSPAETGDDLAELGRAMQLAWLGSRDGTQAPDVIDGWLTDKAAENPSRLAVEPRLLITKNELSTMTELLYRLVTLADDNSADPADFFTGVRGVLADMVTDPNRVIDTQSDTLGGALEYLERLPYRSQLLNMTEDRWSQSAMLRRSAIDGMRQKIVQYRKWLFDPSVWTALYDGAPDGELVFAMPLDVLP